MTDSTSDKNSACFSSTQSIEEIRSSCWTGFLNRCCVDGRVAKEEGDPERDPEIGSAGVDVGVIGVGLPCTG